MGITDRDLTSAPSIFSFPFSYNNTSTIRLEIRSCGFYTITIWKALIYEEHSSIHITIAAQCWWSVRCTRPCELLCLSLISHRMVVRPDGNETTGRLHNPTGDKRETNLGNTKANCQDCKWAKDLKRPLFQRTYAKSTSRKIKSAWEFMEKLELLCTVDGQVKYHCHSGEQCDSAPKTLKIERLCASTILFLGIYATEMKAGASV